MKKTRRKYPCICHPNSSMLALGLCRRCYQYYKKYMHSHPKDARVINCQKIIDEHDKRKETVAQEWNRDDKIKRMRSPHAYRTRRNKALRDRYGITIEDYEILLMKQNGVCAICGSKGNKKPLYVDHNHTTKKVRGLLCPRCNTCVGFIEVSKQILKKADEYLLWHDIHGSK